MNSHDKIELPPLPLSRCGYYSGSDVLEYARAAIEADRKRRGEPVKITCKKCNGTGVESTRFHGVWPNGEECLEPIKCDQCDGFGTTSAAEPVKVPSSWPKGKRYTVERHGDGYAIYQGRDHTHHGLNLAHLTECTQEFSKQLEAALNSADEPARVPSDADLIALADGVVSGIDDEQRKRYGHLWVKLCRLALAHYGQPTQPAAPGLRVSYDAKADCLYITCGNEPATAQEDDYGMVHRFAVSDGRRVGVTIPDFLEGRQPAASAADQQEDQQ